MLGLRHTGWRRTAVYAKALAGTELKRITSLEYYACNAHIPVGMANPLLLKSSVWIKPLLREQGKA
jgi:hypothetical protein